MLPLGLFALAHRSRSPTRSRCCLYAALSLVMFLAPINLIQMQHYTATAAGAALLPFP